MQLVKPSKTYEKSWKNALKEFEDENVTGFWDVPTKPKNITEYIRRTENNAQGINLPDQWVPATTYWLIDKNHFIGHIDIRHELSKRLEKRGGHIGYAIRPSERNKGYGTKMLDLGLKKARSIGLKKVMVTCDLLNTGSRKIIEAKGGVLQDVITVKGEPIRRYWIEL